MNYVYVLLYVVLYFSSSLVASHESGKQASKSWCECVRGLLASVGCVKSSEEKYVTVAMEKTVDRLQAHHRSASLGHSRHNSMQSGSLYSPAESRNGSNNTVREASSLAASPVSQAQPSWLIALSCSGQNCLLCQSGNRCKQVFVSDGLTKRCVQ
ncbi:hypothetical protein KBD08_02080 [Candidatus Babeliales bacterium]|nr:hypothetical protein [Candidatus Babeliales bacterium]